MRVVITPEEVKKEIERILKDRFDVENIGWDDDGSAIVDTELDKILKENKKSDNPWIQSPYKPYTTPTWPLTQTQIKYTSNPTPLTTMTDTIKPSISTKKDSVNKWSFFSDKKK